MKDDILTYRELCDKEEVQTIQRGMNFRMNPRYSVILMSQRGNAPYKDRILEDGFSIEYEGHDAPKSELISEPKNFDQPEVTKSDTLTQNGLFKKAVEEFKSTGKYEIIKVYEKLFSGVWSDKGLFKLTDYKIINDGRRKVFRFILESVDKEESSSFQERILTRARSRIIHTEVKKSVWERDGGQCVICGARDELHFDHDLPFSKGGTSISPSNVRILCARHNLQKSDKIE
jgi:hypothetical protein